MLLMKSYISAVVPLIYGVGLSFPMFCSGGLDMIMVGEGVETIFDFGNDE